MAGFEAPGGPRCGERKMRFNRNNLKNQHKKNFTVLQFYF